jgi:hypothetical protein
MIQRLKPIKTKSHFMPVSLMEEDNLFRIDEDYGMSVHPQPKMHHKIRA